MSRNNRLTNIGVLLTLLCLVTANGCTPIKVVAPPANSTESKLIGAWEADPVSPTSSVGKATVEHTTQVIHLRYAQKADDFSPFLSGEYVTKDVLTNGSWLVAAVAESLVEGLELDTNSSVSHAIPPLAVDNGSARSQGVGNWSFETNSDDPDAWTIQLDPNDSDTIHVSWVKKDGTVKLDRVKFCRTR